MRAKGLVAGVGVVLAFLAGACESGGERKTMRDRQDDALADPFGYKVDLKEKPRDISGGGLTEFDRDAFKRDVDAVFNP